MTEDIRERGTAHWLAARVAGLELAHLPQSTLHAARRCLVDAIGCAAAGRNEPAVHAARAWAQRTYARGESSVWFTGESLAPVAAAFVNASASSILDLDDGHRVAAGHPGAAILPAVLAAGEARGASMDEMLLAIVAGYEAGVLCARLRSPAAQATVATGRWSTIGVAAALARLMRLDAQQTRHALTVAESHAPNLLAADHSGFQGGHVKEGIPWSVVAGFAAVELASHGFTGYDLALSNPAMYRAPEAADEAGRFLIETTYYKRYACCRWTHGAIDAACELRARFPVDAVPQSISIRTFTRAATLPNQTNPRDVIAAQFSVPFVVAAAWLHGPAALLPLDERLLADAAVADLAGRIDVTVDPQLDAMYPLKVPAVVRITCAGEEAESSVVSPVGDWDNPLSDAALVDKAVHLSGQAGSPLAAAFLDRIVAGNASAGEVFAVLHGASSANR